MHQAGWLDTGFRCFGYPANSLQLLCGFLNHWLCTWHMHSTSLTLLEFEQQALNTCVAAAVMYMLHCPTATSPNSKVTRISALMGNEVALAADVAAVTELAGSIAATVATIGMLGFSVFAAVKNVPKLIDELTGGLQDLAVSLA